MGIDEVLGEKRPVILELAQKYGVSNVRVFGSVARGEAQANSDVDFLVDVRPGVGLGFFSLWGALEDLLGCEVDLVTEPGLRAEIREHVLQEAVPL
jgi:predicted nucleotidyltransferase